jgi:hypothetical protein
MTTLACIAAPYVVRASTEFFSIGLIIHRYYAISAYTCPKMNDGLLSVAGEHTAMI